MRIRLKKENSVLQIFPMFYKAFQNYEDEIRIQVAFMDL